MPLSPAGRFGAHRPPDSSREPIPTQKALGLEQLRVDLAGLIT
jgi:hypothetical protein